MNTLLITHNKLCSVDDIDHLVDCEELKVVDLSHNYLNDPKIIEIFGKMKSLRVLTLTGNPVISKIHSYRKSFILACNQLCYLDDRPITENDRLCAEAWSQGGVKAEQDMRTKLINDERRKISDSVNALIRRRDETGGSGGFGAKRSIPMEIFPQNDTCSENMAVTNNNLISVDAYEYISDSESSFSDDEHFPRSARTTNDEHGQCGIRISAQGEKGTTLDTVTENNDLQRVVSVRSQRNGLEIFIESNSGGNGRSGLSAAGREEGNGNGTFDTIGSRSTGPVATGTVSPTEPSKGSETDRDHGEPSVNAVTVPGGTVYRNVPETPDAGGSNVEPRSAERNQSDSGDEFSDCRGAADGSWTSESSGSSYRSLRDETDFVTPKFRSRKMKTAKNTSWCCTS